MKLASMSLLSLWVTNDGCALLGEVHWYTSNYDAHVILLCTTCTFDVNNYDELS